MPQPCNLVAKGVKVMPALPKDAEERDFNIATNVVKVLDTEYGTKIPQISETLSTVEKLNLLVKYMWKVFGYSFYSGIRCEDERSVALKCYRYERSDLECPTPRSEF